jgi:hypothetical protein
MKKPIAILLIALLSGAIVSAQSAQDVFTLFLSTLAQRNEEIYSIAMPAIEIHTVPDIEDEAVYVLTFNTQENYEHFMTVLTKENIPNDDTLRLVLFYSDLVVFIFSAAIGL